MKKIYVIFSMLILAFIFVGCNAFGTTDNATTTTLANATTSAYSTSYATSGIQTTNTIDKDAVISDVYQKIYEEIYNQVKAEVMQDISDQKFDEIYNAILSQMQDKIADGTYELTPESIIDMIHNVEETAAQAVIGVTNYDSNGDIYAVGSGVIYKHVGNRYYVLTNHHVVEDGSSFKIRFEDGSTIDATLRGSDSLVDIAVLYFDSDQTFPVATFADSDKASTGDIVLAVGNPSGYDYFGSMTMGIISGTKRYFDIDNDGVKDLFVGYIQHDAALNGGNSGGALFNVYGQILGVNVIKLADVDIEGMGFAIPGNLVQAVCADIEEYGYSIQKPMLGISFLDISEYRQEIINDGGSIPNNVTAGFYITAVAPGTTLDGLVQPDDIIVKIADIDLLGETTTADDLNSTEFIEQFSKYKVGDVISIDIYRDGTLQTINNITLKAKVVD